MLKKIQMNEEGKVVINGEEFEILPHEPEKLENNAEFRKMCMPLLESVIELIEMVKEKNEFEVEIFENCKFKFKSPYIHFDDRDFYHINCSIKFVDIPQLFIKSPNDIQRKFIEVISDQEYLHEDIALLDEHVKKMSDKAALISEEFNNTVSKINMRFYICDRSVYGCILRFLYEQTKSPDIREVIEIQTL